jgi:hypothetical protein
MPSATKLIRFATLPETRHAIVAAASSPVLRDLARRAATDRAELARDLRKPANVRDLLRDTVRHPATRELGGVGFMLLPGRYLPLGLAAGWATRGLLRRLDPPAEVLEGSAFAATRRRRNVTPKVR